MGLNNYYPLGPLTVIQDDNRDPWVSWQHHLDRTGGQRGGVDLVASVGTPVIAPTDGVVDRRPNDGSAGNSMRFVHDANPGWSDVFSHLDRYVGSDYQHFNKGDIIAYSGNTGGVTQHLHRHLLDPQGNRRNPWDYWSNGSGVDYAWGLSTAAQLKTQQALTKIGYYSGLVDGEFGDLSVRAFQQWLKDNGYLADDYDVDGVPGVVYGRAVQTLATKYGYDWEIDGYPGPNTSAAIERWAESILAEPPAPVTGILGIDVATSQRNIDFVAAKAQDIVFSIAKAGGRNVLPEYTAPHYAKQVDDSRATGLKVGHYYVTGTVNPINAKTKEPQVFKTPAQQAEFFVSILHNFNVDTDVLAIDNEPLDDNPEFWNDAQVAEFVTRLHELTGIPYSRIWVYFPANLTRKNVPWTATQALGVKRWWAAYGDRPTVWKPDHEPDLQGSLSDWDIHQFSSSTKVGEVTVDANYSRAKVDDLFAKGEVVKPVDPEIPVEPGKPVVSPGLAAAILAIVAAAVTAIIAAINAFH